MSKSVLRLLPSVELVRHAPELSDLVAAHPAGLVTSAIRDVVADLRRTLPDMKPDSLPVDGNKLALDFVADLVAQRLKAMLAPSLTAVINGTGVVVHTNLGRAPLGEAVFQRMREVGLGYSNLEYRVSEGGRGSRFDHVAEGMRLLTGAEACLVVNNNAAAVLLVLTALSRGREVLISRGELVEIGGSFRVPDVMAQGGAILREVGTTNRTHLRDFENALGDRTGLILKVHRSNYEVTGFTLEVSRTELVELAHRHGVPYYEDEGSGILFDLEPHGIAGVETVARILADGADLISFSGDKMMGGPQSGIIAGRKEYIQKLRQHPLARALRPDKLTLAALESIILAYLDDRAGQEIPVVSMLTEPSSTTRKRAEGLASSLRKIAGVEAEVVDSLAAVGGGSLPGARLPSAAVAIAVTGLSVTALELGLRKGSPVVVARIEDGSLLLDLKTVADRELEAVCARIREIASATESAGPKAD